MQQRCARDFALALLAFLAAFFFGTAGLAFFLGFAAFWICFTFSATDLVECHTASPSALAIASMVRPLTTDFGFA